MNKVLSQLIRSVSPEEKEKRLLQKAILAKKSILTRWITKTEMLRVELEIVKQQYDVRVGSLYLKDNQLDLEIIHLRNILSLMEEGMSFEQAKESLQKTYYAEQVELEKKQERIRFAELFVSKREEVKEDSIVIDIKKLWKQLIAKFHADLVQDPEEKTKRDNIMKQINLAYETLDLDALQRIDNESYIENYKETTVTRLEEILVALENDISKQIHMYHTLRMSEWYAWKKRLDYGKKKAIDIFKTMENKLLDDIVRKYEILHDLQARTEEIN